MRGLGTDRFGILALAWMVLGYFSLFNLGLGRATTKFVAELLGKSELERLPELVWTSLVFHILLGAIGGVVLGGITPLLVERVFRIPLQLTGEARSTFFILAASVPVVTATACLRGVLEAAQRFGLVNAVKIPSSSLIFLIPAAVLPLGFQLPGIVLLLLVARIGTALAYLVLGLKVFPILKFTVSFERKIIQPLFSFGGWVTVSNVVGPVLMYLDRFLIGSLLTVRAVAYYTAPYEMVGRLGILATSMAMTLFPAFSTLGRRQEDLGRFYGRSIKYLLLLMGPLVVILVLFAGEILRSWLGVDFAEKSTLVFQILAIGVLVNSLAHIPFALLQGLGRPDITAKFHLLELPLYIGLAWFLVREIGISGAALAWTLRIGLDGLLLFGASWKLYRLGLHAFMRNGLLQSILALLVLIGMMSATSPLSGIVLIQGGVVVLLVILFALAVWRYVLDTADRNLFTASLSQLVARVRGTRR